jgi:hypothetical protein
LALGDSSTKYFFNHIKPRQQKEALNEKQLPTGNIITNEPDILNHIHEFYMKL